MTPRLLVHGVLALGAIFCVAEPAAAQFTFTQPGKLVSGSGTGRKDYQIYAPDMRFPIENAPAYPNSQVWGNGGSQGPGGSQCDKVNFSYPWKDNYCETRSWDMPLCPAGTGHQGQDIRAAGCENSKYWAVAAVSGTITSVGSYSVYLTAADGTRYDYLHMSNVQVSTGQKVAKGQQLGKVSNVFNGTPTTVHLHFNLKQNVGGVGIVYVPPFLSLVESYQGLVGKVLDASLVTVTSSAEKDAAGVYQVCPGEPIDFSIQLENTGTARWVDLGTDGFLSGERVRLAVPDDATEDPLTGKLRLGIETASNDDVRPAKWGTGGDPCTTSKCRQTIFKLSATAPTKLGPITTAWRLRDYSPAWESSLAFGPKVALKLDVVDCSAPTGGAGGASGGSSGAASGGLAGHESGGTSGGGGSVAVGGSGAGASSGTDEVETSESDMEGGCSFRASQRKSGLPALIAAAALVLLGRRRRMHVTSR